MGSTTVACLTFIYRFPCVFTTAHRAVVRGCGKKRFGTFGASLQKSATLMRRAGLLPSRLRIPDSNATARFQHVGSQSQFQGNSQALFRGPATSSFVIGAER